jgi:hypothetical protein
VQVRAIAREVMRLLVVGTIFDPSRVIHFGAVNDLYQVIQVVTRVTSVSEIHKASDSGHLETMCVATDGCVCGLTRCTGLDAVRPTR